MAVFVKDMKMWVLPIFMSCQVLAHDGVQSVSVGSGLVEAWVQPA
jgi:hypothetical protein